MAIVFQNVSPVYLEKEKVERSQVWNQRVELGESIYIQVTAPSGSGKTSFVHFLYGLRKDYTGNIFFNGLDLATTDQEKMSAFRQSNLSIIFQDMRLFPDHTLFENIEVKRALQPFHGDSPIQQMAERLGIATKLNQAASKCSYGEQQRAAIIRALQQPFEYLLMDEPFSHLDDNNRKIAMDLIIEEAEKRKAGIIMADLEVNHDFPAHHNLLL